VSAVPGLPELRAGLDKLWSRDSTEARWATTRTRLSLLEVSGSDFADALNSGKAEFGETGVVVLNMEGLSLKTAHCAYC